MTREALHIFLTLIDEKNKPEYTQVVFKYANNEGVMHRKQLFELFRAYKIDLDKENKFHWSKLRDLSLKLKKNIEDKNLDMYLLYKKYGLH